MENTGRIIKGANPSVLQIQRRLLLQRDISRRASRFDRTESPCPAMLQARDREILKAVYQHRFLSSSQIKVMFFGCIARANIRLRKLWQNNLLDRHFIRPLAFHGSSESVYSLGVEGVGIVADAMGVDRAAVSRIREKNSALKPLFIEHMLEVNDFSINFASLVNEHPELALERWINEGDLQDEYERRENGKTVVRRFRPDGYGRYIYRDRLYSFFLELDRATEDTGRFEDKVKSYIEYQQSGSYQRRFGVRFFRVLVATTTARRMNSLRNVALGPGKDMFWFTTIDNIRQRRMFQPVWVKAGSDALISLL